MAPGRPASLPCGEGAECLGPRVAAAMSWGADGQRKLLSQGPGGWEVQIGEDPLLLRIFTASSLRADRKSVV